MKTPVNIYRIPRKNIFCIILFVIARVLGKNLFNLYNLIFHYKSLFSKFDHMTSKLYDNNLNFTSK